MEGVVDHLMRDMLTRVGGFDQCVTEFVRVVDQKIPKKTFYRLCPELHNGGKTPAGVPVRVQLLGQHPQWLAENAQTAIELGSPGVDLNFGCPAKTVNKSKGGAVLLKETQTLYDIVKAVSLSGMGYQTTVHNLLKDYFQKFLRLFHSHIFVYKYCIL